LPTAPLIFPDGGERYLSTTLFTVQEKVTLELFNTIVTMSRFTNAHENGGSK